MPKRVGITTDIDRRKQEWKRKFPNLHSWRVVASSLTKQQAQDKEDEYIRMGYEGHPGGRDDQGSLWSVYTFEH